MGLPVPGTGHPAGVRGLDRARFYETARTAREYEEYERQRAEGGLTKWELWNIDNLGVGATDAITITRFDTIPEDAIWPARYNLDLRRCATVDR